MAVLDILKRMRDWTDEDLARFFRKLYFRKVKYLRIFLFCVWGPQGPSSQPHVKDENGVFDLEEFNEDFFKELARLARIAYDFRVALYVDLFDHCGTKREEHRKLHPYYNNKNNIKGMYDRSPEAQEYRRRLAEKVIQTIGLRGSRPTLKGLAYLPLHPNWFGLINEGYCTQGDRHLFGEHWAYSLAHALRELGYKEKILFSAYDEAAHAIAAYVSTEGNWSTKFKKDDTVRQFHGMIGYNWADDIATSVEHGRWFATSTDGTYGRNPSIPLVVSILDHIRKLCREPFGIRGNKKQRYHHHHEELSLSISEIPTKVWEIDADRDLEVYSAINRQLFGMKRPNRKTPKWLLRKYKI